jgi:branched-chain amino acid transport system permease protein
MREFTSVLISGLSNASVYALLAMGLALVYGVSKVFNFAYGSFFSLAGYLAWVLFSIGLGYPAVIPLVVIMLFVLGAGADRLFIRPLRPQKEWETLVVIATLGMALILDGVDLAVFGPFLRELPPLVGGTTTVGGFVISNLDVAIFCAAAATIGALLLFLSKTKMGLAIRAVAQDIDGAQVVGIKHNTVFTYTFAIAAALAAVAGILLASRYFVSYKAGWDILLKAWVITAVGGMGSLMGAAIAAVGLALLEAVVAWKIGASLTTFVWFGLLIVLFIFRPQGIMGRWG